MTNKNTDYISRDEYFMGVAMLSAQRSKDPRTRVGACIVNPEKRIVGTGYNGFPKWCSDDIFPREREGEFYDKKYAYVVHAEANAILNATTNLQWCTIYVYEFPCNECAKLIIQSWITNIKYLSNKYEKENGDVIRSSKRMLDAANIHYEQIKTDRKNIELNFKIN